MNEMAEKLADKAKAGLCYAEFPTYDGEFYVPEGFIDISFAKDIVPCPSIMDAEAVLVLRQDFANPDLRAMRGKRYRVDICREEIMEAGYESCQPYVKPFRTKYMEDPRDIQGGMMQKAAEYACHVLHEKYADKVSAEQYKQLQKIVERLCPVKAAMEPPNRTMAR